MTIWIPTAAAIADIVFFPAAAFVVFAGLRSSALSAREKRLFAATSVLSILAKVALASLGHNYDVDTWKLFSDILGQGKNLYADTDLYRYGPIWAWILSGFGHLTGTGGGERFHMEVSAFLAVIDVLTAMIIARVYSWRGSMVFLLSPVSLLISGFHSQLENVAILMGLLAWLLIRNGNPKIPALLGSSICLGISLVVKHVMFVFPVWLLFWRPLGKLRYRVLYAAIAYGLFAGGFLPWWWDPASRAGILKNVFSYRSAYGMSFVGYVAGMIVPIHTVDQVLPRGIGLDRLWMVFLVVAGVVLARKYSGELYLLYVMLLYASSPSMATQYVIVPMIAAAIFYLYWESWAFMVAATLGNLLAKSNIGYLLFESISRSGLMLVRGRPYNLSDLLDVSTCPFFLVASQFCIGVLFWKQWRRVEAPSPTIPLRFAVRRVAVLIALGGLPVVIEVIRRTIAYGSLVR